MKCPHCGKSLWFVQDVCPFCKTALPPGDLREPAATPDREDWVTLTKCRTILEADVLRSHLDAADIESFLPDESLMQAISWNVNTYGFIRLQVRAKDYESAKQILASIENLPRDEKPDADRATIPLSWPMRCIAFALPVLTCPSLLILFIAQAGYANRGFVRKAKEWVRWYVVGLACGSVTLVTIILIRSAIKSPQTAAQPSTIHLPGFPSPRASEISRKFA